MNSLDLSFDGLYRRMQWASSATSYPRCTAVAVVIGGHALLLSVLYAVAEPDYARLARMGNGRPPIEVGFVGISDPSSKDLSPASQHPDPVIEVPRLLVEEPTIEIAKSAQEQEINTQNDEATNDRSGTLPSVGLGARVLASEADVDGDLAASVSQAVVSRIEACLGLPLGSPAEAFSFTVTVSYKQDGTLAGTPVLSRLFGMTETEVVDPTPLEQAALDAVKRCAPIGLPPSLYRYWALIDIEVFKAPAAAVVPLPRNGHQIAQQQGSAS